MVAPTPIDGRRARSNRTRQALITAYLAELSPDTPAPTSAAVAARAGVSQRTLFHQFATLDDLRAAAKEARPFRVVIVFENNSGEVA